MGWFAPLNKRAPGHHIVAEVAATHLAQRFDGTPLQCRIGVIEG